jgi:hypothetical protein
MNKSGTIIINNTCFVSEFELVFDQIIIVNQLYINKVNDDPLSIFENETNEVIVAFNLVNSYFLLFFMLIDNS